MNNIEGLHRYIQKVAKSTIGATVEETVVSGTIVQSLAGVYEVQIINGASSSLSYAYALGDSVYKENDNVYLLKGIQNSGSTYTVEYVIFGLVDETREKYEVSSAFDRFEADLNSLIKCGFENGTTFDITNPILIQNIRTFGCFDISANVSLKESLEEVLDYGINIDLKDKDGEILESFSFNTPYFIGQPYKANNLKQHRFIEINKNIKDEVKYLTLTFFNETEKNVEITNIELVSGSVVERMNDFSLGINIDKVNLSKESDVLTVTAKGFFQKQELSANVLRYFWFIKDESVKFGSEGFCVYGGDGWRCLNSQAPAKVVGNEGKIVEDKTVIVWENKDNTYVFTSNDLNKFENIIKCIALYQNSPFESDEFVLYNFLKENYDATITSDSNDNILYLENSTVTLTCNVVDNNIIEKDSSNKSFVYRWYVNKDEQNVDNNTLTISKDILITHPFTEGEIEVFCRVYTEDILVATTNTIKITSLIKAFLASELTEEKEVMQWLSEEDNESFKKEGPLEIDGYKYSRWVYNSPDGSHYIDMFTSTEATLEALNLLAIGQKRFIYHSEQTIVYKGAAVGNKVAISKSDYSKPIILRYVEKTSEGLKDLYTENAIDQLNTFNSLTNNGANQGLFRDEETGNVHINAEYIRTGALTVKTDEDKPIFQAGWDKDNDGAPLVKIAGFDVSENKIFHGNTGDNDYVSLGVNHLDLGTSFNYKYIPPSNEDDDGFGMLSIDGEIKSKDFSAANKVFLWKARENKS